jgi:Zn-finger nucleic acid-binding protein
VARPSFEAPAPPPQQTYEREPRRDRYESYQQQPYRKKRKESWLSEIFD